MLRNTRFLLILDDLAHICLNTYLGISPRTIRHPFIIAIESVVARGNIFTAYSAASFIVALVTSSSFFMMYSESIQSGGKNAGANVNNKLAIQAHRLILRDIKKSCQWSSEYTHAIKIRDGYNDGMVVANFPNTE